MIRPLPRRLKQVASSRGAGRGRSDLAARHRAGLRRSSLQRNHVLADRSVRRVDRRCRSWRCPPPRRCCRTGSSPPAIRMAKNPYVLYAASNLGSFAGAARLSVPDRAVLLAAHSDGDLVLRLCGPGDRHLRLRHDGCAAGRLPRPRHRPRRAPPTLGSGSTWMALTAIPAGPLHRGDRLHHHRSGRGAVPVGAAARALSPDLRWRVPRPALGAARLGAAPGALRARRRSRSASWAATRCIGWRSFCST